MSTVLTPSSTTAAQGLRLPSSGSNITDNILGSGGDYTAFCDPNSPFYDPVLCLQLTGSGTSVGTSSGGGGGDVNVTVTQSVNVANNIGAELAAAINSALLKAAQAANQIALQTADQVSSSLGNVTTGILNGVNSAFGQIGDFFKQIISAIGSNIGDILKSIVSNIGSIASQVASAVTNAIGPVVSAIGQVLTTVQTTYSQYIQPVLTLVQQSIQTISALTVAIERDLNNGLQGILQLPGDIANGLGSLDATLDRTMQQLGVNTHAIVTTTIGGTADDTIWTRLKGLGSNITSVTGSDKRTTTFTDLVKLPEPTLTQAGAASFDAIWKEVHDVIVSAISGGQPTIDSLKTAFAAVPFVLGDIVELPAVLGLLAGAMIAGFWPLFKFVQGDIASKAGLEKLDSGSALQAWVRGFIDDNTLLQELSFQGYDAQRVQILRDLRNYLLDINVATDLFLRGIIDEQDLRNNLKQHGVAVPDQDAIIEHSYRKVDVGTATTAFRWQVLDDTEFTAVLKSWGYTDNEVTLAHATLYQLESQEQVQQRLRLQQYYAELGFSPANLASVPQDVLAAAAREGNSAQVALDGWQRQFNVPSPDTWIELYFRGVRTSQELKAALNYWMIPEQLQDDMIQARKALIPFRTIPTMLANGIISEPYAKAQLQAHGFDLVATEALLKYASVAHTKKKTAILGDPLQTSVTAAHELWTIGAFTDDQFAQTLTAHGFTADQAKTIIASDKLAAEAKDRKALANDIVNEVLAGLLTIDDAKTLMAQQQFTIPESARVLKSIAKTQRATSKTPAEAELTKMVLKHAITFDDWKSAMSVNGFAQKWIDAFATLNFGNVNGPQTLTSGT